MLYAYQNSLQICNGLVRPIFSSRILPLSFLHKFNRMHVTDFFQTYLTKCLCWIMLEYFYNN